MRAGAGLSRVSGRYRVNVLPLPGVLLRRISPPRRLLISRLMDSPSPVPPYFRAVPVSACWNGSKITLHLSAGMPIPVSRTAKAMTRCARFRLTPV